MGANDYSILLKLLYSPNYWVSFSKVEHLFKNDIAISGVHSSTLSHHCWDFCIWSFVIMVESVDPVVLKIRTLLFFLVSCEIQTRAYRHVHALAHAHTVIVNMSTHTHAHIILSKTTLVFLRVQVLAVLFHAPLLCVPTIKYCFMHLQETILFCVLFHATSLCVLCHCSESARLVWSRSKCLPTFFMQSGLSIFSISEYIRAHVSSSVLCDGFVRKDL